MKAYIGIGRTKMSKEETYQELMRYALKRFNSAYDNHLIKDDLVREIETTLNTLTEKIYNTRNQRTSDYFQEA
tara:strand:- start:290 stop:508 length:219 start_codon:yes stop_codon:yes gene_type:complete